VADDSPQRRLDVLAADVFAAAGWVGATPAVTVDGSLASYTRARCSTRPGREHIRVHPRVLDEPPGVQRGTLAHEIAHLLDDRQSRGWPGALVVTAVLWGAAFVAVVVALREPDEDAMLLGIGLSWLIAAAAWRVWVGGQRRCELRADAGSVVIVGRDTVLETLRHLHRETPAPFRAAAAIGLETHPSPAQRIRHITAQSTATT